MAIRTFDVRLWVEDGEDVWARLNIFWNQIQKLDVEGVESRWIRERKNRDGSPRVKRRKDEE